MLNKLLFISCLIFVIITIHSTNGIGNHEPLIVGYSPANFKPQVIEGETLKFSITVEDPDSSLLYYAWMINRKVVKIDRLKKGQIKHTISYNYTPDSHVSGRQLVTGGFGLTDKEFSVKKSWPIYVANVRRTCGDGIWNIGEDINNCPIDANKYSLPPTDQLKVLNVGGYTYGMYIFPAWHGDPVALKNYWKPIMNAKSEPKIYGVGQEQPQKPIMNYYDDTNPVVVDWMIKWSLEHGINLFIYDWYASYHNEKPIDVFLEEFDGKYKPYKDSAKFALLWSNQQIEGATLTEKERNVMRQFEQAADKYFGHPQYFRIGNKPMFIIFDPVNLLIKVFGAKRTNELFKKMKNRMKERGYNGLYIVLNYECTTTTSEPLAFDGVTSYNYSGKMHMPVDTYDNLVEKYNDTWIAINKKCQRLKNLEGESIKYFPPTTTGWDNTPWKGTYSSPMYISSITGGTPEKFKKMLLNAKHFVEQNGISPKIIIINAWDEWGEGSVLAPRADKWGLEYLEAVRSVSKYETIPP